MREMILGAAVLAVTVTVAGAAGAADLPRRHHAAHRGHVAYVPPYPAPPVTYAPRYRVRYQTPSNACAEVDFCTAAFGL